MQPPEYPRSPDQQDYWIKAAAHLSACGGLPQWEGRLHCRAGLRRRPAIRWRPWPSRQESLTGQRQAHSTRARSLFRQASDPTCNTSRALADKLLCVTVALLMQRSECERHRCSREGLGKPVGRAESRGFYNLKNARRTQCASQCASQCAYPRFFSEQPTVASFSVAGRWTRPGVLCAGDLRMASATPPGYPAKDDAPAKPAGADLCGACGRGGALVARIPRTAGAARPEVQHPAVLVLA